MSLLVGLPIIFLVGLITLAVLPTVDAQTNTDKQSALFVPELFLSGSTYYGTIVSEYPGTISLFSSNPNVAKVIPSITLGDKKQRYFEISAIAEGPFTITAKIGDEEISSSGQVYFPGVSQKALDLILFADKTHIGQIRGYVYVMDSGSPQIIDEKIKINISSKGTAEHPDVIYIMPGTTGASFSLMVQDDISITASTDEYLSDTEEIEFIPHNIIVNLEVAPEVAAPDDIVYAVISFSEGESHFIPPRSHPISIHSSNPDVATTNSANPADRAIKTVYLNNEGIAMIPIHTHQEGQVTISADVTGFGSASADLYVGPIEIGSTTTNVNGTITVEEPEYLPIEKRTGNNDVSTQQPNTLLGWIFPKINSGIGYMIFQMYYTDAEHNTSFELQDDGVQTEITRDINRLYPVEWIAKNIFVSSNGINHVSQASTEEAKLPTNVIIKEWSASKGEYTLSASSPSIENAVTREVIVGGTATDATVRITPLPVIPGFIQDVAILSINNEGILVDPQRMAAVTDIDITATGVKIKGAESFTGGTPYKILRGDVTGGGEIDVTIDGIGNAKEKLYISSVSGEEYHIEIYAPDTVFTGEPFGAYAFIVDSAGVPRGAIDTQGRDRCVKDNTQPNLFVCKGVGGITSTSKYEEDEVRIIPRSNEFDVNYKIPDTMKFGGVYPVDIEDLPVNAEIEVRTSMPYNITNATVTFEPQTIGTNTIYIILKAEGYSTQTEQYEVTITDDIDIQVTAKSGGEEIAIEFTAYDAENTTTHRTPYTIQGTRGDIRIDFNNVIISDTRNLEFVSLFVDDRDSLQSSLTLDTTDATLFGSEVKINAVYKPTLTLHITDKYTPKVVTYGPGEEVILPIMENQPIHAMLAFEEFVGWESNNAGLVQLADGRATLTITENTTVTSQYVTNWTPAAIIAAVVLVVGIILIQRKNNKFVFMTILDKFRREKIDLENMEESEDVPEGVAQEEGGEKSDEEILEMERRIQAMENKKNGDVDEGDGLEDEEEEEDDDTQGDKDEDTQHEDEEEEDNNITSKFKKAFYKRE